MPFTEFFKNNDDMWTRLKNETAPILLYGTGNGADRVLDEFERLSIEADGVFVSDGFARGQVFRGFKVMDYSSAQRRFGDFTVVQAFGSGRAEVIANAERISSEHTYYAADVPVFGDNIFNRGFALANSESIGRVYDMLDGPRSRGIYENLIKYKFTGLRKYLTACECTQEEIYSLLNFSAGEKYLDLGAYTGDTAARFISLCPDYSSVTACEPDPKNFKKLERNTASMRGVRLVNACVAACDGEATFHSGAGRGSARGGAVPVKALSVDSILDGGDVTYLKADVEGAELDMIAGMKNTLSVCKPKMRIACYHRSEDVFTIPLAVCNHVKDYKVHIVHTPHTLGWDTDFIFI